MLCFSISSASLGKKKQTKEKADVTEDEEEGKKEVPIRKNRSKGRYVFFFKIKPKRLQFSFIIARLPQIYSPYMTIYGLYSTIDMDKLVSPSLCYFSFYFCRKERFFYKDIKQEKNLGNC